MSRKTSRYEMQIFLFLRPSCPSVLPSANMVFAPLWMWSRSGMVLVAVARLVVAKDWAGGSKNRAVAAKKSWILKAAGVMTLGRARLLSLPHIVAGY